MNQDRGARTQKRRRLDLSSVDLESQWVIIALLQSIVDFALLVAAMLTLMTSLLTVQLYASGQYVSNWWQCLVLAMFTVALVGCKTTVDPIARQIRGRRDEEDRRIEEIRQRLSEQQKNG